MKILLENKKLARFTHYLSSTRVYTSYCKDDHLKEGRRQPCGWKYKSSRDWFSQFRGWKPRTFREIRS